MLKTTKSTRFAVESKDTKFEIGDNNVVDGNEVTNKTNSIQGKNQAKMTKSKDLVKSKNHDFLSNSRNMEAGLGFLTLGARLKFTKLRQAFVKASILHHFDLKCHM